MHGKMASGALDSPKSSAARADEHAPYGRGGGASDSLQGGAPKRRPFCTAQLAECAVDPAAANAELLFVPRAGKRVPWPALVQTRAIAPGEPLCWVYNSNPTTPMGRQIRQWRRQEEELQELRASAEAARRQRRTDLNRDIRGRFKKDGRLKCV